MFDVGPFFVLYFLFFCSGVSGLIYQVVWVRLFGNIFGNTVYSAALVVAVFMFGLGLGSYLVGAWADRRYSRAPDSLLRSYGAIEVVVAAMGIAISVILPHLGGIMATLSSYIRDGNGWYVLSSASYIARMAAALVLLTPVTILMGGTLTLLIRHLVRSELDRGGRRIARLYAVNTLGAAAGALLTDFALVPAVGLLRTQMIAASLNLVAGIGAFALAAISRGVRPSDASTLRHAQGRLEQHRQTMRSGPSRATSRNDKRRARVSNVGERPRPAVDQMIGLEAGATSAPTVLVALSLVMIGFAAMGMEILWFRHFTILLGGFRAVFSLLLAIILVGIGAGSLLAASSDRRGSNPASWLMLAEALFVTFTLLGLATSDATRIESAVKTDAIRTFGRSIDPARDSGTEWTRSMTELWFNARPMLLEIGLPVLLMGLSFPLANAIVQRTEQAVGRRAGALYLANTIGAVAGSLAAGFLLLPGLGIQAAATTLCIVAALAIVPLSMTDLKRWRRDAVALSEVASTFKFARAGIALLIAGTAIAFWLRLPTDYVIARALAKTDSSEQLLARHEGLTEVIEVTETGGQGRRLLTNGHPMSATTWLSQRYMRALAHIPLLTIDEPQRVLIIGFGVGNTTHAAALHPSVQRLEVADLSNGILSSAGYFSGVNQDVIRDQRVAIFVNDGRQHLQMQPPASYDLIALEPPPIGYAGVAALYSKEFYELARGRLTPKGFISQWLPAYQVPAGTTLAMVRAFIDVFPHAVLLSGAEAELLLIGANGSTIEIDPARLATRLATEPAVRADLQRLDLGGVREIVGTFVGSATKLAEATGSSPSVTDDRPIQEYGVRSLLEFGEVPPSIVDLSGVGEWCPKCFVDGKAVGPAQGVDTYLALAARSYAASSEEIGRTRARAARDRRLVAGSAYLGAIVPESADLHNALGISHAQNGEIDRAIAEFREALAIDPHSAATEWHLGAALAERGQRDEAVAHLRRSVELDPDNALAREDLRALTAR